MNHIKILFYYVKKMKATFLFLMLIMAVSIMLNIKVVSITVDIVDIGIASKDIHLLVKLITKYFLISIGYNVLNYLSSILSTRLGARISVDLRDRYINNLLNLSGKEFLKFKTGDLSIRILNEVEKIQSFISQVLITFIFDLIFAIAFVITLLRMNYILTALNLVLIFTLSIVMIVSSNIIKKATAVTRKSYKDLSNSIQQLISRTIDVIFCGSARYTNSNISKNQNMFQKKYIKMYNIQYLLEFLQGNLEIIMVMVTLGAGGIMVVHGSLSMGVLVSFNLYIGKLLSPILRIMKNFVQFKELGIYIDRVYEIINMRPEVNDSGRDLLESSSTLEFKDVNFSYNGVHILNEFSFAVKKGEILGVLGRSGTGKTTIVNLLMRMWNLDSGKIVINQKNIDEYTIDSLRNQIGVMSQDTVIFDDTLRNNFTLGNSSIMDEEIIDLCGEIGLLEFIENRNGKLDEMIEENGKNLSGGQKQRISLVRILLQKREILILDEPTSALDGESERKIVRYLNKIKRNKIIIVITHNLELVEIFDKIIYTSSLE